MGGSFKHITAFFAALVICSVCYAEDGVSTGYSPYSKFGIGNLTPAETAFSTSMGGIGTAMRNNRFINVSNPAAVTARDSLAFMGDYGISQNNSYFSQGSITSVHNTFNISSFVMSFPIWKSSAFMIGISPYGNVGYDFNIVNTDPQSIGYTGNITDNYSGTGTLYNLYLGAGVTFWRRLSLGAQFDYYFGNIEKSVSRDFTSANYASIYYGNQMYIRGFGCKVGLQYEQPIQNDRMVLGATLRIPTKLSGENLDVMYVQQSSLVTGIDTLDVPFGNANIPMEVSVGLSYTHAEKFTGEIDYSFSDWTNSGMDNISGFAVKNFSACFSQRINVGFEYIPNRTDIRYYMKRVSYRVGGYYKQDYYKYCGHTVEDWGISIGATFPIFRWYNGLSLSLTYGQKGSIKDSVISETETYLPIQENYFKIGVSFNIFDIWFIKPRYE